MDTMTWTGPASVPLFTLQGDLDVTKLRGLYKLMISIMLKTTVKGLSHKPDRTPEEEDDLLSAMTAPSGHVTPENLSAVLDWYRSQG